MSLIIDSSVKLGTFLQELVGRQFVFGVSFPCTGLVAFVIVFHTSFYDLGEAALLSPGVGSGQRGLLLCVVVARNTRKFHITHRLSFQN